MPTIDIYLDQIEENVKKMLQICQKNDIKLTGVVKGAAGDQRVMQSFMDAGLTSIGDSRLKNIIALRQMGYEKEVILLRLPALSEIDDVIKYVDISLVSEVKTCRYLSDLAQKIGKKAGIIVMVDVGDLREGVLPEELIEFFAEIIKLPSLEIKGLGTNVGCYGGVLPTVKNTQKIIELKDRLENEFKLKLPMLSGGNTATTKLIEQGKLPAGINHLRVGEGLLQGTDITHQREIDYLNSYNFQLSAEIIELKEKPSLPTGEIGCDAFGNQPEFIDKGIRRRAILAVGRQDTEIEGLIPVLAGVQVLGASSDHLLVDVTDLAEEIQVGDKMRFYLNYSAMLRAMTSPYLAKQYHAK